MSFAVFYGAAWVDVIVGDEFTYMDVYKVVGFGVVESDEAEVLENVGECLAEN